MLKEEKTCPTCKRAVGQFQIQCYEMITVLVNCLLSLLPSSLKTMTKGLYGTDLLQPQEIKPLRIKRQQPAYPLGLQLHSRKVAMLVVIAKDYPTAIFESRRIWWRDINCACQQVQNCTWLRIQNLSALLVPTSVTASWGKTRTSVYNGQQSYLGRKARKRWTVASNWGGDKA